MSTRNPLNPNDGLRIWGLKQQLKEAEQLLNEAAYKLEWKQLHEAAEAWSGRDAAERLAELAAKIRTFQKQIDINGE